VTPSEVERTQQEVAVTCAALGTAEFAAAWAEGQSLTLESAIAYAIG
jgi:hypothetical protein